MAATSPYTPNDYNAVSNFRPYELPINDIFKSISAQNAFWDAGAAKVKSVYDNALNLKLSLEPNKEIRKKYIEDAEKQLTRLSSMDLADPNVQRQGFALFKPLFQDEGIIFDDLTTRHYEKVRNDALMYRTRDNGKGYSDINFQYAMTGYNEFLNSQDRMAGKSFYQNRKEYTPYYDYTEDFQRALKDCKPSSYENSSPVYGDKSAITGYAKDDYYRGLSAAQTKGCLEAGLSTNGQRQLQIEGAVGYRNNLPVLASDTATYLSGVSKNLSGQLQELSAKKSTLASKKDLSEAEKKAVGEQLDLEIQAVTEELDRTNNQTKKIMAGDLTDIQNNFDSYAGSVYSYKKLYKKALASAFSETKNIYKADPVQLTAIRFSQEKYLRNMDYTFDVSLEEMRQQHAKEMKLLDLMYGGSGSGKSSGGADVYRNPLTGEITINPNLMRETGNLTDEPEVNKKIYSELTNSVSALSEQDNKNNLTLYNNLKNRAERDKTFREGLLKAFNYGNTDDEWARFKAEHANNNFEGKGIEGTPWFKSYTAEKPDDEDVNRWSQENTVIEAGLGVLNRKLEIGEAQVRKELGGDYEQIKADKLKEVKSITLSTGETITAQEVEYARKNPGTNVKGIVFSSSGEFPTFKGKSRTTPLGVGNEKAQNDKNRVFDLYDKTYSAAKNIDSKLEKKRIEVYNQLGFDREPWYFTPNEKAPVVETIKAVLGPDKEGKELPIKIISSDFSGGIKVSVPGVVEGAKKSGTTEDILNKLRAAGVGTSAEATGDGVITIRGTTHNVVQQALQNPVLGQAAFQMASIGATTAFAQTQEGDRVVQADIKIPVMMRGKQETITIETYKRNDNPEYRVFVEGATVQKPIVIASNAYELFEKIGRLPMDLNKPIK